MKNTSSAPNLSLLNYVVPLFERTQQNMIILMDAEGFILKINTAFTAAFGYDEAEIIGRNFSILFTEENKQKICRIVN